MGASLAEKTGVNSMLGVSPSTPDFVRQVAISDMFEIQSSMLAKQRGDAAEQAFAEKMIEAHGKTTAALKELTGADFNKRYRDDQVKAHKDAIDLFERYAKGGDNEALKQWARATPPELRSHLDMADKLQVAENMAKQAPTRARSAPSDRRSCSATRALRASSGPAGISPRAMRSISPPA